MGLRSFACWDCGFESHQGHGCLTVVSVVCCQEDVSVTGWSLVQRSATERGVSNRVWSWSLDNEEAMAHWGLLRHWGEKIKKNCFSRSSCDPTTCWPYSGEIKSLTLFSLPSIVWVKRTVLRRVCAFVMCLLKWLRLFDRPFLCTCVATAKLLKKFHVITKSNIRELYEK
jgi:hypothetical protein